MGVTLTFYAAPLDTFLAVWLSEDDEVFHHEIETFTQADFSLHLHFPDDIDQLWRCFRQQGVLVRDTFEADTQLVWSDDEYEQLLLLHPATIHYLADLTDENISSVATAWVAHYPEWQQQRGGVEVARHALQRLKTVATVATEAACPVLVLVII